MNEIEKKFLVDIKLLPDLSKLGYIDIEQAYLNVSNPIIRVRKYKEEYFLTYKSKIGDYQALEYELPLTKESYNNLLNKRENNIIFKKRYNLKTMNNLTIELDVFGGVLEGLIIAEIEFKDIAELNNYKMEEWFTKDVSLDKRYMNSNLSKINNIIEIMEK